MLIRAYKSDITEDGIAADQNSELANTCKFIKYKNS